ncbi:MAG: hypothetical protein U0W40_20920, partial [Acidimicrobiia bacterium]
TPCTTSANRPGVASEVASRTSPSAIVTAAAAGAGGTGNALAFTGAPTLLLSSLGGGLAAVGLALAKLAKLAKPAFRR